jgi:hypothetical protein
MEEKGKMSWGLESETLPWRCVFVDVGTRIELGASGVGELVIYGAFVEASV